MTVLQKFPPTARIKRRSDFMRLNRHGERFAAGGLYFLFSFDPGRTAPGEGVKRARLGITVVCKQGNSVERNRFKRLVREVFRRSAISLIPDLSITVRPKGSLPVAFSDVVKAFSSLEAYFSSRS